MKKLLLIALLPATLMLQACNDRQVATGVGIAGGAILGAAIANSYSNRHYYGSDYYYGRGYYGYGDGYYGDGYYGGYWNPMSVQGDEAQVQLAAKTPKVSHVAKLAAQYRLSTTSARKIVTAFNQGANEDFSGFEQIGLNRADLETFANAELPSEATIVQMSRQLQISPEATKAMLQDMIARSQAARSQQAVSL